MITSQIIGLILLYFLIGFILSNLVIKELEIERSKNLLKNRKLPSVSMTRWLTILLWPVVILLSFTKIFIPKK